MSGFSKAGSLAEIAGRPFWFNAGNFIAGLRRVSIFAGGYGSGKSEIAVNFALSLTELGTPVTIADLDIVNPYFRSREARQALEQWGVRVLMPPVTVMETDLPMIGAEIRGAMVSGAGFLILDLGGDPVGARVMASLSHGINRDEYNSFFVLNSRRPFTRTVSQIQSLLGDIESTSGLTITHLVVNSHLIEETTAAIVQEGIKLAEAVSAVTAKPIAFIAIERRVLEDFDPKSTDYPVLVLERQLLKPWEQRNDRLGPRRFKI
ncbi:MAG: hypothetical protein ABIK54_04360 [candidate division WOR-3 bacterium]